MFLQHPLAEQAACHGAGRDAVVGAKLRGQAEVVEVLLDLALGDNADIALEASTVLKTQVFLYEADTDRLEEAHRAGHSIATDILNSYAINIPEKMDELIDMVISFLMKSRLLVTRI